MNNFYAKKLVNLDEVDKFLEGRKLPKLTLKKEKKKKKEKNLSRPGKQKHTC